MELGHSKSETMDQLDHLLHTMRDFSESGWNPGADPGFGQGGGGPSF